MGLTGMYKRFVIVNESHACQCHPIRELPAVTNDFLFHPLQRMEGKGNHLPVTAGTPLNSMLSPSSLYRFKFEIEIQICLEAVEDRRVIVSMLFLGVHVWMSL